ncbi:hypothetical protein FHS39_001963 [Streptomyces olivoverticillatus]|uniref:DUF2867 domain-containing protein n=1 Tax=Streptomyces olivoverticillatus TaxID=66427 RepID=A0A7W7PK83_9ACTN|nr:hypothetical protein [Streptomyces olivoverticillatus]MBB4892952.1 hypothetical protein [Streptomyces olivoverticillatus]
MVDSTSHGRAPHGVRHVPVPPAAQALSTLARIDYANALLADVGPAAGDRTAEQWARAVMEDAPADTRQALTQGWTSLGLQLGPARSDGFVLGWPVRHSAPDIVLLSADPTLGLHGQLLLQREERTLLMACFIQLDSNQARALWAQAESRHPEVMHQLLEQAVSRAAPA